MAWPQPGDDRECIEMLAKAAGFSQTFLEAKRRKGEVEREAYMKAYYRNQAFCEKINNLGLPRDRSLVLLKISIEIANFFLNQKIGTILHQQCST